MCWDKILGSRTFSGLPCNFTWNPESSDLEESPSIPYQSAGVQVDGFAPFVFVCSTHVSRWLQEKQFFAHVPRTMAKLFPGKPTVGVLFPIICFLRRGATGGEDPVFGPVPVSFRAGSRELMIFDHQKLSRPKPTIPLFLVP